MSSWDLLDEKTESEIHKSRLLNVEERPFKRITKRIGAVSSLVSSSPNPHTKNTSRHQSLKEDLTLDFAAFDSSLTRLQFLHDANARERARYEADQQRIIAECQDVRSNNADLRQQLEGAKATLTQRKKFDELAEKIISSKMLKPREEQVVNLAKLEEECKELERESETYSETWKERRDQFNRIMEEGMLLRRQIRDEKEEVDRREGMNEGGDDDRESDRGGATPRPDTHGDHTPRPDGVADHTKPNTESVLSQVYPPPREGTPLRDTPGPDGGRLHPNAGGSYSRGGSMARSRDVTPAPAPEDSKDDVEMDDARGAGREAEVAAGTPQPNDTPSGGGGESMDVDS